MAAAPTKQPTKALALLLNEMSDCLGAAGSDSGSEQNDTESLTVRMRTVLDGLLDRYVDEKTGKAAAVSYETCRCYCPCSRLFGALAVTERELQTVSKLITISLGKYPAMFSKSQHAIVAIKMLCKLVPLVSVKRLRCA